MSKLIAQLRQDFPKYDYIKTIEAAIPAYSVQIVLEAIQYQELSTFQRYILDLLSLHITSIEMMAYYLGVDQDVLTSPIVGLLKQNLVVQGEPQPGTENRLLSLTERGQEAVTKQGPRPVPTRKTGRLLFDALTERIISPEEKVLYPDQVEKEGFFVLPKKEADQPTLGLFAENEKDVKAILEEGQAFEHTKIVGFLKLKEVSVRYFAPMTVVVLQNRETHAQTVAVYRNSSQQRPETEALQRLLEAKKFTIPSIGVPLLVQEQEIHIPTETLSSTVVQEIRRVVENEHQREEIVIRVEEHRLLRTATQDAREREELEKKLTALREDLKRKNQAIDELRQQLRQSDIEFLRTEQHREKLIQAIREAKQEILIISPWITPAACDDQLCQLFAEAIGRGVQLHIGYGMGKERTPQEAEYNRHNVEEVKKVMRKYINKLKSSRSYDLERNIVNIQGTHQKILICDRQFAITGSFNWLSYTGKQGEGYRQELSVLFRHPDQVNELAKIALEAWNTPKK